MPCTIKGVDPKEKRRNREEREGLFRPALLLRDLAEKPRESEREKWKAWLFRSWVEEKKGIDQWGGEKRAWKMATREVGKGGESGPAGMARTFVR